MIRIRRFLCLLPCLFLVACMQRPVPQKPASPSPLPQADDKVRLPENLSYNDEGIPLVKVYVTDSEQIEEMDLEAYLAGVVAGEMRGDWPAEALKAQALLARSFALRFLLEKGASKYEGADLSTDVEEAQAYDAQGVNNAIRQAIQDTRGLVVTDDAGMPIQAWFHSHSGGMTAYAKEGLDYEDEEPPYIHSVKVEESPAAPPEAASWTADFSLEEVEAALQTLGGGDASALAVDEWGPSGRVTFFSAGEKRISAPSLRLALDGTRMRSTLLTDFTVKDGVVHMEGKGYGHGVGMSQWGAYALAENGKTAEQIVDYFFKGVRIVSAWRGK